MSYPYVDKSKTSNNIINHCIQILFLEKILGKRVDLCIEVCKKIGSKKSTSDWYTKFSKKLGVKKSRDV